jgi:malate synthase
VQGQQNLWDAARGRLAHTKEGARGSKDSKDYTVGSDAATLLVRARGIHMLEMHVVDEANRPMPAGLFDIAMYMFHNAQEIISQGGRPLLYVPKLESFEEAVLVHDVIEQIEQTLGIPHGTTRVTALIETLPGILQAEEIGFALGPYWAGLNCGRWDHIFSILKNQATNPTSVFPDRSLLGMTTPFLTQYMQRIVQVCHSRGVHAMGGMSALIPSKDAKQTELIMQKVKVFIRIISIISIIFNNKYYTYTYTYIHTYKVVKDKEYELANGCDGAWVAHPAMVAPIRAVFEAGLQGAPNQLECKTNLDFVLTPSNLVSVPPLLSGVENYTETGLRGNISVGIGYLSAWLDGAGAVAIGGLMEDLATAEISRTQVWQWLHHNTKFTTKEGKIASLDKALLTTIWEEEVSKLKGNMVHIHLLTPLLYCYCMLLYVIVLNPYIYTYIQSLPLYLSIY